MTLKQQILPLILACVGIFQLNQAQPFLYINDQQVLEYCKDASHSYVAIVWPRGIDDLAYILKALSNHADIRYVKQFSLEKKEMLGLYRKLHKSMSRASSKKYFKPYITSALHAPFQLAAIVFDTRKDLEAILRWKKDIRDYIGESYYSIHINDRCQPETFEAAQAVFKDI